MGLKKLIKDKFPTTKFSLRENDGIIVFEIENEYTCLYLMDPSESELVKLSQFKNSTNMKFVGSEKLYITIKKLQLDLPPVSRTVFTSNGHEVIYYTETGKIRFEKDKTKKNVLIVDDSKTIQKLLSKIIEQSDLLSLVGIANCPSEAQKIIESNKQIDLITLDIHMPEMDGVQFLKSYLGNKNIPTVMISSVSMHEGPLVMEALSSGAYTYIQKPALDELYEVTADILEKLETVAKIGPKKKILKSLKSNFQFNDQSGLIAIGSSTGGTQALQEIFTSLPDNIPPIVVVQHIPAVFSKALADRLDTLCQFHVKEAEDGEFLQKNTIYIAPGGRQMKLSKVGNDKKIIITDDPPLNRFRPSVDYLFNSIPALEEKKLLGVILTGMGKDGAKGLLELKKTGASTIAQDEESSIVFGMPKEAIALGAASKIVSLSEMAANIVLEFNKINRSKAA